MYRVSIDLPRTLTGKLEFDHAHESGDIFGRIADKETNFVGKGCIVNDSMPQLSDQLFTRTTNIISGLLQQDADACMG